MQNDSGADFEKIQQQAVERARQMQQKAQLQDTSEEPKKRQTENGGKKTRAFNALFNLDSDMSMLMPLMLLLSKEGADELLIMALLYIMS